MAKVTGIVKIYLDGELIRSKSGASITFGGYEKTAQKGHKLYGFSEEFVTSEIEFTIAHMADTDVAQLNAFEGTLIFETDTGKSYTVANATTTSPGKLTGGEGDLEFTMMGEPAEEA